MYGYYIILIHCAHILFFTFLYVLFNESSAANGMFLSIFATFDRMCLLYSVSCLNVWVFSGRSVWDTIREICSPYECNAIAFNVSVALPVVFIYATILTGKIYNIELYLHTHFLSFLDSDICHRFVLSFKTSKTLTIKLIFTNMHICIYIVIGMITTCTRMRICENAYGLQQYWYLYKYMLVYVFISRFGLFAKSFHF